MLQLFSLRLRLIFNKTPSNRLLELRLQKLTAYGIGEIENELNKKGLVKSTNPDILVSIFTKSREKVNVTDNNFGYGFGWGYNPWFFGSTNLNINQYTEGTLFIDFIDKNKNELVWQGIGSGAMKMTNIDKKEERINEFVNKIILAYPPNQKK